MTKRPKASDAFNAMSPAGQEAASGWSNNTIYMVRYSVLSNNYLHLVLVDQAVSTGPAGAALGFGGISATDFANCGICY